MAAEEIGIPAGSPAMVATRHSPCDSPAVSKRSMRKKYVNRAFVVKSARYCGSVIAATVSSERLELRAMLRLAAPLVAAELGWMMMGIVDTMCVGRVSADAIGAVSLGSMVFYTVGICASGA